MKQIFHCPSCSMTDIDFHFKDERHKQKVTTWMNIRDGWGFPIRHIICPNCGYVLSGVMYTKENDDESIWYIQQTINKYSREGKDGGYIEDGKLNNLIKQIEQKINLK